MLDQHAAAALVQIHPAFGQVAFVAPDQHQDGAEQWGGSQLQGRWSGLHSGIECISSVTLLFGSQAAIQGIPEAEKPLDILGGEALDLAALELGTQRTLALAHACWSAADDHPVARGETSQFDQRTSETGTCLAVGDLIQSIEQQQAATVGQCLGQQLWRSVGESASGW